MMGAEGTLKKVLRYRVLKKRKVWNETYLNYYYYTRRQKPRLS
jgi:hypothetical protein